MREAITADAQEIVWRSEKEVFGGTKGIVNIKLHPAIRALVNDELNRCKKAKVQSFTADELVNEILWLALRTGNVSKHYSNRKTHKTNGGKC